MGAGFFLLEVTSCEGDRKTMMCSEKGAHMLTWKSLIARGATVRRKLTFEKNGLEKRTAVDSSMCIQFLLCEVSVLGQINSVSICGDPRFCRRSLL